VLWGAGTCALQSRQLSAIQARLFGAILVGRRSTRGFGVMSTSASICLTYLDQTTARLGLS
jgi:hypothetical protein